MNATLKKIMTPRNIVLALIAALIVAAFLLFKPSANKEPRYRTETVASGSISQTVSASGTLNPVTLVSVGTQVSGLVEELFADFNDRVEKDQMLVRLDDSTLQATVRQSEANLGAARSALTLAQTNLKRLEPLAKEGFVSAQEHDQARQSVQDAKARVTQLEAQLERDRTNLSYSIIRSPVAGVVVLRSVDEGQTVAASFNTPELFQIAADLKEMQIDAYFAEADIGQIREGQRVSFRVDAFPDERFRGVVKQVRLNPKTESNVVTYAVIVSVANPDEKLMPGMTAYVDVTLAEKRDVIRVPNAALRFKPAEEEAVAESKTNTPSVTESMTRSMTPNVGARSTGQRAGGMPGMAGGPRGEGRGEGRRGPRAPVETKTGRVYVLENNAIRSVEVKTGIADRSFTEITDGLEAGMQLVVEDLSLMQEFKQNKGFMMGM